MGDGPVEPVGGEGGDGGVAGTGARDPKRCRRPDSGERVHLLVQGGVSRAAFAHALVDLAGNAARLPARERGRGERAPHEVVEPPL